MISTSRVSSPQVPLILTVSARKLDTELVTDNTTGAADWYVPYDTPFFKSIIASKSVALDATSSNVACT